MYCYIFSYSLGIIMVELLTMESPFHELLDHMAGGVNDLLDALSGRVSIKKLLPHVWEERTGLVRPTIPSDTDAKFAKVLD